MEAVRCRRRRRKFLRTFTTDTGYFHWHWRIISLIKPKYDNNNNTHFVCQVIAERIRSTKCVNEWQSVVTFWFCLWNSSQGFLLQQLWIVNYYIKCLSNNCWFFVRCFFSVIYNECFMIKRELKCQNELFLKCHLSGNTSNYVFIPELIWQTFGVIFDDP